MNKFFPFYSIIHKIACYSNKTAVLLVLAMADSHCKFLWFSIEKIMFYNLIPHIIKIHQTQRMNNTVCTLSDFQTK